LVIGDPAAGFLRPLDRLHTKANIILSRDRDRLGEAAAGADVIFNAEFRDPTLLFDTFARAKRVRWVHNLAAGVEKILAPEIVQSPVPLTNGRGVFRRALGEWAVGAMLFFAYDLGRVMRSQAAGIWDRFEHEELYGKTLGIVGYGEIGRAVAEHAKPFGMRILGLRRNPAGDSLADAIYTSSQIDEMIKQCDYIAISAPLTSETRGLVGAKQIAAMKSSAVIVNVGRGPVIDETALIAALESKRIRGAALDVFDVEPLPVGHPFYRLENVLMSAHGADNLPDSRERGVEFFIENFERFEKHEPLQNVVDKHAGY
jgi:phosphoglycerate dehydrogenase-like enzyme